MIFSTINFKNYLATLIIGIFTVALIIIFSTELIVRFLVEPNHIFFKHIEFVKTIETNCAAIGDSHTALGFSGNDECINLGYPGESFSDTYEKIHYLNNWENLRKVIIQTDPIMFSKDRLNAARSNMINYLSDSHKLLILRILDNLHTENLIRYWRTLLFKWEFVPVFDVKKTGWMAYDEKWKSINPMERNIKAKKEALEQSPVPEFSDTTTALLMEKMIASFINQGTDICLVTYPMSTEYLEFAEQNLVFELFLSYLQNLADTNNIKYINMLRWKNNDSSLFANADHLNIKGAMLFTEDIIKLCEF